MRALRVVGLTEDGEVVLEDPVRLERFRVPADERLRAAARGDLSRLGQIAIELESQLRPREIQARIRAGASVEQVAAAAGVPEQKIERFAYPVLLERFRTAEIAQRAHPVRAEGPDNRTLAEVVEHTFGLRGQAYEGARWDSWKGEDGRWVVALDWRAGRSHNRAHWTFQPGAHGGTVTALDEHASDLVEGLPARPLRTVGAVVDMHPEEGAPTPTPAEPGVEQWRAAASDSYRERMPHAPEPRPTADRGSSRPAPEPWRAAPPAQRQGEREPVEARVPERAGSYRGSESRATAERETASRPAAEWAPADRGTGVPAARAAATAGSAAHTASAAPAATSSAAEAPATPPTTPPPAAPSPGTTPAVGVRTGPQVEAPTGPGAVTPADAAPAAPAPAATGSTTNGSTASAPAATGPTTTGPTTTGPTTTGPTAEPTATAAASTAPATAGSTAPAASAPAQTGPTATAPAEPTPSDASPAGDPPASATAGPAPDATPTPPPAHAAAEQPETPAADTSARRTRKGKPVMPSWDEVLLGVRGPR